MLVERALIQVDLGKLQGHGLGLEFRGQFGGWVTFDQGGVEATSHEVGSDCMYRHPPLNLCECLAELWVLADGEGWAAAEVSVDLGDSEEVGWDAGGVPPGSNGAA